MNSALNKSYLLPWKEQDNPNGWIEPTTFCNITCPGCYRGIDKKSHKPVHLPLKDVLNQIDWHMEHRNIHTLSVSGGDPLLYPYLKEVVEYAADRELRVMIYTNGLALTERKLTELRDAGAAQILVHIDRYQNRPDIHEKMNVSQLRQKFCDLFKKVDGIMLGFIQPVSVDYSEDVRSVMALALENINVVSLVIFTLYREICWETQTRDKISTDITVEQVVKVLWEIDGYVPAAALPSENNPDDMTWVFGTRAGSVNSFFGYSEPSFYKFIHERYRERYGRFLFISRNNRMKMFRILRYLRYRSVRRIWKSYLSAFIVQGRKTVKDTFFQSILILRGPEKRNNRWDLCKGCPDRIIHNGRLVPSCILEDIKQKENKEYQKVEFGNPR